MKIKEKGKSVLFGLLECGAVFQFDGNYYMKIMQIDVWEDETSAHPKNVILLDDGFSDYFGDNAVVIEVKCQLVIE